jgi:hypothetical protein
MRCAQLMVALSFAMIFGGAVKAGDWSPAEAPIVTRWAEDVSPADVHPEYPRPQLVRERWLNLNGLWEFAFADEDGEPLPDRALSERILVPFPVESALSGIGRHGERLWYRRTFDLPADWRDDRVLLHFEAVDWAARVWINGSFAGEHRGGYDRFTVDITDYLREDASQEIVVGVWDPTNEGAQPRGKQVLEPGGIWYTPCTGIWQTVWLEPVPRNYIRRVEITPDVDRRAVEVTVIPGGDRSEPLNARAIAERDRTDASGPVSEPIILSLNENYGTLWSPDHPQLYELTIELRDDAGVVLDSITSYFALRKIEVAEVGGVQRLLLNGKPIFHIGTLDQGYWPDGIYTAPTDEALRYDIEITKKLGFNTIRKHVKIEPDRWYFWCDRLGVLVWQDMPSGDAFVPRGQREVERSAEGRGNHPCIVMWVPFNEGWGQYDTQRITDLVRTLDPTRLVNSASGWHDHGTGDVHDIHSYPGPAAPEPESDRAGVLGEFGGLGLGVDGHTWAERTWGYRGTADSDELTRRYEQLMRGVWSLKNERGLAAAIYTQITDVETECNGLLTYDRAVVKVDVDRVAAANRGRLPRIVPVVPTAQHGDSIEWRYTTTEPPADWIKAGFDDASWARGPAGFGREGTPGAVVRTTWTTDEIWLRRTFTLDAAPPDDLMLYVHHDEDAEIYINGVKAATLSGYTTTYEEITLTTAARAALRPGPNVLAVHCRQTTGGQYIDVGFVRLVPAD